MHPTDALVDLVKFYMMSREDAKEAIIQDLEDLLEGMDETI